MASFGPTYTRTVVFTFKVKHSPSGYRTYHLFSLDISMMETQLWIVTSSLVVPSYIRPLLFVHCPYIVCIITLFGWTIVSTTVMIISSSILADVSVVHLCQMEWLWSTLNSSMCLISSIVYILQTKIYPSKHTDTYRH